MSFFKKLFGGGDAAKPDAKPEEYEGFKIFATPIREGTKWRVSARIEKEVAGAVKVHELIRADTLDGEDAAIEASIRKARQVIDEQGERVFS